MVESVGMTYTRKLLESLEGTASEQTLAKIASNTVHVGSLAQRELVFVICNDLLKLLNQAWVVNRNSSELGQRSCSLLRLSFLDEVAWRLGQYEHAPNHDESPSELNCDWDTV